MTYALNDIDMHKVVIWICKTTVENISNKMPKYITIISVAEILRNGATKKVAKTSFSFAMCDKF